MTVLEMGGPAILTIRMRFSGLRVGSVTRPWAASVARRAARLPVRGADLIGISRATGLPRRVTRISSPCLIRRVDGLLAIIDRVDHAIVTNANTPEVIGSL